MSSDLINTLSYSQNINNGVTVTTEKLYLAQYVGLSIVGKSDQDIVVTVQYSGDGINYDHQVSKTMFAATNFQESLAVFSKYCRVQYQNSSGSNTTYFRSFVYGSLINTQLSAVIEKVGGVNPQVNITEDLMRTAFSEIITQPYNQLHTFRFDSLQDGYLYDSLGSNDVKLPYDKGHSIFLSSGGVDASDGRLEMSGSVAKLLTNETSLNKEYIMSSPIVPYNPGIGMDLRFTGIWQQPTVRSNNQIQLIGLCTLTNIVPNMLLCDGIMIGFDDTSISSAAELEIVHYRAGSLVTRVKQSAWNGDKCDGSQQLPVADWTKLNLFRIQYGYLGIANATVQMYNRNTEDWISLHTFKFPNTLTSTSFQYAGFRIAAIVYEQYGSTSKDGYIGTGSMSIGLNGAHHLINQALITKDVLKTGVTTETLLIAIRNNTTSFLGGENVHMGVITSMSCGMSSSGSNNTAILRCYRQPIISGGSWFATGNLRNPFSFNSTGTYGGLLQDGAYVKSICYSIDASETINLGEVGSKELEGVFNVSPGEAYAFTCESSNSANVRFSVTFTMK